MPLNAGTILGPYEIQSPIGAGGMLFQESARSPISSTDLFSYDVFKDGKRFLVNRFVRPDRPAPLTIVLNATADVKK
jgi:hypothetical protein